ncbi:putative LPS assembly protein LptD [soil metagenome]
MNFWIKVKFLAFPFPSLMVRVFIIFLFFSVAFSAFGQVEKPVINPKVDLPTQKAEFRADTVGSKTDTLKNRTDSLSRKRKSDIATTIRYSARDSINSSLDRKIVHLYGDATIHYGDIELIAEEITIDYEKSTISANGKLDSLGRRVGFPIFTNGGEKYETKDIVYNFKNKKARISEVVTTQGDGFIHSLAAFKNEKNELLTLRNAYTTCNLAHPHYQIIASKAKAIPGDQIVVGPFHMEVNDVPLPLGFVFGIFPSPRKSASGIIVPSYGEENNRGFFLRNGGYFFDVNDYFKLQMTGDLYSKGSSALYINSMYRSRYSYNGSINFSYTNNKLSSKIEDQNSVNDFRITWSHTPQSRGTGRFSASVNAATATYNNSNFIPLNTNPTANRIDATSRKLSSNVSYSKTFGSLFSLGINYRINQDLTTKQVDMPLHDLSFTVNNVYPLKKLSDKMIFQNLSTRYTMTATNNITNNLGRRNFTDLSGKPLTHDSIAPFSFKNLPIFFKNANKGVKHTIPISTSMKLFNFFTLSPSLNYDETWYFDQLVWKQLSDSVIGAVPDTLRAFNRVVNYSVNAGLTTRIYGTYFFKKKTGIQAIRHVINPSIGFSYAPDFGQNEEYYSKFTVKNNPYPVYKSRHEGFAYGSSRRGESAAMSFGINNTVEMKVKGKKDTVSKKVSLFNSLSINSAYNFAADSFKLAPFSIAANTNVLNDKLNINITGSLDPYKYATISKTETEVDRREIRLSTVSWTDMNQATLQTLGSQRYHLISQTTGFGRITSANLALSTNLNPKGQKKDTDTRDRINKANASESDKQYLLMNPDSYIDFKIPWNLRISYNANYTHTTNSVPLITQTVRFNGDLSLTEKWKITYNSGYDFQQQEITTTQLTIARDLHCWVINLSWVPFGKYQSYNFYIGIKSSLLKDLKMNRTRSFYDR